MGDDLMKRLRGSCYLAFDDGTNDYASAPEAADLIEDLIGELEAHLARYRALYEAARYEVRDSETKLAKAVETISLCRKMQAQFAHTEDPLMVLLDTTIAELKG